MKKESRRELQCKEDELEDARAASGKKVKTITTISADLIDKMRRNNCMNVLSGKSTGAAA